MTDALKVGEVGEVFRSRCGRQVPYDVVIIAPPAWRKSKNIPDAAWAYLVQSPYGVIVAVVEHVRRKRAPGDDVNDVTTWDNCLWQPRTECAVPKSGPAL